VLLPESADQGVLLKAAGKRRLRMELHSQRAARELFWAPKLRKMGREILNFEKRTGEVIENK